MRRVIVAVLVVAAVAIVAMVLLTPGRVMHNAPQTRTVPAVEFDPPIELRLTFPDGTDESTAMEVLDEIVAGIGAGLPSDVSVTDERDGPRGCVRVSTRVSKRDLLEVRLMIRVRRTIRANGTERWILTAYADSARFEAFSARNRTELEFRLDALRMELLNEIGRVASEHMPTSTPAAEELPRGD